MNNTRPITTAAVITARVGQNLGLRNDQRTQTGVNISGDHTGETKSLTQRCNVN